MGGDYEKETGLVARNAGKNFKNPMKKDIKELN
jgi:hypothetical protein